MESMAADLQLPTSGSGAMPPPPPPPTPSNHSRSLPPSETGDTCLSQFLLRNLTLTLPSAPVKLRSPPSRYLRPPPTVSLLHSQPPLLSSVATDHGFFHLTDHGLPGLPPPCPDPSALAAHPRDLSPLGLDLEGGEEGEAGDGLLVFDEGSSSTMPADVVKHAREMGRVGVEVVGLLLDAAGLSNPFKDGTVTPRWLLWVSLDEASAGTGGSRWRYPYVVCLQQEVSWGNTSEVSLLVDDGAEEVRLATRPDSVLVALGDIAQVWSNGRFKKVRGRALPILSDGAGAGHITMSLMVTLPAESVVSPLPRIGGCSKNEDGSTVAGAEDREEEEEGERRFCSFPFEQYAWRLYNERLSFKDPLLRYRFE